jgi:hypothetical protein
MSTITARAIRRSGPRSRGLPTLLSFDAFLQKQGVSRGFTGRPVGSRVLDSVRLVGPFATALFRHPTKTATAARMCSVTWRTPERV